MQSERVSASATGHEQDIGHPASQHAGDRSGAPHGLLATVITTEIRQLRRGRGVHARNFDQRLGPALRELATDGAGAEPRGIRQALIALLGSATNALPQDLRTAIGASLGIHPQTLAMTHFKDRVSWLAGRIGRLDRTAVRRIEEAERLLAERLAAELSRRRGRVASMPEGWYLDEFRTLLRMDTPGPESYEDRRIVATRDGLREVMAWLDLPGDGDRPGPTLAVEAMYGGRLVRREAPTSSRIQIMLQLPHELRAGQAHEFGLVLRVPPDQTMRSHYIFTPECQCNAFALRVRFDPDRKPQWVRRVTGETVRQFDNANGHGSELVTLDDAGELSLRFEQPRLYLGYGAQWQR
jgi:hypothetical protein